MTVRTPPAYLQGGVYTALLDRDYLVTVRTQRNMNLTHGALQGFFPDRAPTFASTGGWNWVIGPCAGVVANTFGSDVGDYLISNPSNQTGSVAASSATLNRNDLIGFQIKDTFYDASGLNSAIPAVIQGANSAGTPSDPAAPASFIPVMRAVVSAGTTTPVYQSLWGRTVPSGVTLPIGSAAERTALGTPYLGQSVWRLDRSWPEVYNGAWRVQGVAICSSEADRNSSITDPVIGQLAITTDTGIMWRRTGSGWIPHGTWRTSQTLGVASPVFDFTGIPSTFTSLRIVWSARSSQAAFSVNALLRLNGDAGANYFGNGQIQQNNTILSTFAETGATSNFVGALAAASAQAAAHTIGEIVIPGWNNPGGRPQSGHMWQSHMYDSAGQSFYTRGGSLVNVAGPNNRITLIASAGNFTVGSTCTIYGME